MKLKALTFSPDDEGDFVPNGGTFELTLEEMTLIASLMGKFSPRKMRDSWGDEYIPAQSGMYNTLIGSVFNRYWDSGEEELLSYNRRIKIDAWREDRDGNRETEPIPEG